MIEGPTKHCAGCDTDFPATEEYFYPSYLKDNSHNICKTCHTKRARAYVSNREKLLEVAQQIEQDEAASCQTLNTIARAIGRSVAKVERDVYEHEIPVVTYLYNNWGPTLALRPDAAEAYIAAHRSNGHSPDALAPVESKPLQPDTLPQVEPETLQVGTPNRCAGCDITKGNILTVSDEKGEICAYLCSTCYRTASSYKWDPKRMRRMADLIEHIGIQCFTV